MKINFHNPLCRSLENVEGKCNGCPIDHHKIDKLCSDEYKISYTSTKSEFTYYDALEIIALLDDPLYKISYALCSDAGPDDEAFLVRARAYVASDRTFRNVVFFHISLELLNIHLSIDACDHSCYGNCPFEPYCTHLYIIPRAPTLRIVNGGDYIYLNDIPNLLTYYKTSLEIISLILFSDSSVAELPRFIKLLETILKNSSKIRHKKVLFYIWSMLYTKILNGKIHYAKKVDQNHNDKQLVRHVIPYPHVTPFHSMWYSILDDTWSPLAPDDPYNLLNEVIDAIENAEFDVDSSCERNTDHETTASVEGVRWRYRERLFLEVFYLINNWVKTYGDESVLIPHITRELFTLELYANPFYH